MSNEEEQPKRETLSKMKQRHKRELQELQKKNRAEVDRIPNAKRPEKRAAKEKGEQAEQALLEIQRLQLERLSLEQNEESASGSEPEAVADTETAAPAQAASSCHATAESKTRSSRPHASSVADAKKKQSRGQRKKANRAAQEKARREQIESELKDKPDPRATENIAIAQQLAPLNLAIKEIRSDGHCLFRAIYDQITEHGTNQAVSSMLALRQIAADYIRTHPDDFAPFLAEDDASNQSLHQQVTEYCARLQAEDPVMWGGHPEIVALAAALNRQIVVYTAKGTPLIVGGSSQQQAPLKISFHQHYYGLGEHYNSVVSRQSAVGTHELADDDYEED